MKLALKRAEQPIVEVPTIIGTPFEGGYYFGRILIGIVPYAIILPSKAARYSRRPLSWNETLASVPGAVSYVDGLANTKAMAEAGSRLGQWALDQRIDGKDDWFIPSRQDALIVHANMQYASEDWLRDGGTEDFESEWIWLSTQRRQDSNDAWAMSLSNGGHATCSKDAQFRSFVVRRVQI